MSVSSRSASVDQKNIGQAVVVVVEDRDPGACGFNDVLFATFRARYVNPGQTGLLRDVLVTNLGWLHTRRQRSCGPCRSAGGNALALAPWMGTKNHNEDENKGNGFPP